MWNEPDSKRLSKIPKLYSTENTPLGEKIIYLHFFIGGCDWHVAEFDGTDIFFGYVILNSDIQNAEWKYFSFEELRSIKSFGSIQNSGVAILEVDNDLYWTPQKAQNISQIRC